MRTQANRGALVAAMAAGLFTVGMPLASHAEDAEKVECHGINACKGKGSCGGVGHDCAGKNACKGKGWMESTDKDCKAKGGTAHKMKPKK